MSNLPADILNEIAKARSTGGGSFINYGTYVFMIKKWFFQQVQDRCIVLDLVSIEAAKKVVYEGDKRVEVDPNAAGTDCSSLVNFDGKGKQSAPANSRGPVLGLFGIKDSGSSEVVASAHNTLDMALGKDQPFAGMLLLCSAYPKEIRSNPGNYITAYNWDCLSVPGQGVNAPELVKARLAALSTGGAEALLRVTKEQLAKFRAGELTSGTALFTAPAEPKVTTELKAPTLPKVPTSPWYLAEGWQQHPDDKRYFYKGNELKLESELIGMRQ